MKILASFIRSTQSGFDSSIQQDVHALFDPSATLKDVLDWHDKMSKNCLDAGDVRISIPTDLSTPTGENNV